MNKTMIDKMLPVAYTAIEKSGLSNNGKVNKSYRGQISTLGAAITMGSINSAICYFSKDANNDSEVSRSKLLKAIEYVLNNNSDTKSNYMNKDNGLENYVLKITEPAELLRVKEDIMNASIAIKLAMNLFEWEG